MYINLKEFYISSYTPFGSEHRIRQDIHNNLQFSGSRPQVHLLCFLNASIRLIGSLIVSCAFVHPPKKLTHDMGGGLITCVFS